MATPSRPDARNGRKAKTLPNNETGLLETLHRFWQKSYAGDYIGLALVITGQTLISSLIEPFHQLFLLSDTRIQHPHAEIQTVPVFWLFSYALGVPLVVTLLWNLIWRRDMHKAHVTALGLAISIVLTMLLTDVLKNAIGRPRPDLLDRCQPDTSASQNELVGIDVCTETDHHLLHDGWRSFPSGHSSFSFAGLGWLALFFASQTRLFHPRASLLTLLFCLAPVLGAGLIAISRLEDYRHDVFDVIAGSLLGSTITYVNWRRYYPALNDRYCEEPYSPPGGSGRTSPNGGFQRFRDEEEWLGLEEGGSGYGGREGNR
jgi:diacylglycerol diphosphate phosphatase/phosphatidate phosphatase